MTSVTEILNDAGLHAPQLRVLSPTQDNYTLSMLQPDGDIEADDQGVRNQDRELAHSQHSAFLVDAVSASCDVAITPEYSTPWQVLENSIATGIVPAEGSLWIIGCESITLKDLHDLRARLSGTVTIFFEELETQLGRFLDPVVYLFQTHAIADGSGAQLIAIVQFKTCAMGDPGHFELNRLQLGSRLYHFGDGHKQLRLATLICSDAFDFTDALAQSLYDRTLLIHIQLNQKPRQAQYRQYRARFMQYQGDDTEIVCLNWAKDVREHCAGSHKCWNNISGSAWYLRPDKYDSSDNTLTSNHKLGLYYTWLEDLRCHALFFSYAPAVFYVTASKVAHVGVPGSLSHRRGPVLTETRHWNNEHKQWLPVTSIDDGFSSIVAQSGDAAPDLSALAEGNPFCAERALALCAGQLAHYEWHSLRKLDSCVISASEIVRRVVACQDTDVDAQQFRTGRLRAGHRVVSTLRAKLPPALSDLAGGFRIDWTPQSPHTNVVANASNRRATVICLGDEHNATSAQSVAANVAEYIGRSETTPDGIVESKQRLHVWYRDDTGQEVLFDPDRYVHYDETHIESPFDIGRSK